MADAIAEFPTYLELTQTQAWAGGGPVAIGTSNAFANDPEAVRYSERAILGVGGMGKVMLARDSRIGRDIALKVLHDDDQRADQARARFLREAQVQGQLEHPSIVPVYDVDIGPDGNTFFTMRRVHGKTLKAILEELRLDTGERRRTRRELLQAFVTVCLAIDYAHSRGVIHRDLKPANIMLGEFGEVYVIDWGVARVLDDSATEVEPEPRPRPGSTMGTPLYMAPEQAANPAVGPAADVFALGAILFEILTLEQLRTAHTLDEPLEARASVRAPDLDIPPELENICVRATRVDPKARYRTARELQEAVGRYLEGDRELEHRRALATEHAARARIALASDTPQDDVAMLELARALALDPTNIEHVAMMSEVLASPPRSTPPEIAARVDAAEQRTMRAAAKYTVVAFAAWLAFVPLVVAMGIRRWDYVFVQIALILVTSGFAALQLARPRIRRPLQYVTITGIGVTGMMVSRLFGPLVLVPTLVATAAIVTQLHPDRRMRLFGVTTGILAIGVPVVLEAIGTIPPSYAFGEGLRVLPQMTELPPSLTIGCLCAAAFASVVLPATFIGRMRDALAQAQVRELMQTWRLRRLGDNMLRVVI